jgi:hypothetical protein
MVAAGVGLNRRGGARYYKWVCDDCKRASDNVRAVDRALRMWEIERGF